MRKVTGYIGALIVVVALMGSILAGYALNINGQSTVVNEYENVTDVSGLYSHTDQKTYIDYNPASNYIGYQTEPQSMENATSNTSERFKGLSSGTVTITNSTTLSAFDRTTDITSYNGILVFSSTFYLHHDPNGGMWFNGLGVNAYTLNFSMTRNADDTHSVSIDGHSFTFTSSRMPVINHPYDDYDFVRIWYGNSFYYADGDSNILILGDQSPNTPYGEQFFITGTGWNALRFIPSGTYNSDAFTQHTLSFTRFNQINNNINYGHVDNYYLNVGGTDYTQSPYEVFVPRYVNTSNPMGIDYTESNRVNNYPVIVNPANTSTAYSTINLQNISATDYWPNGNNGNALGPRMYLNYLKEIDGNNRIWQWFTQMPHIVSYSYDPNVGSVLDESGLHSYRLSDILNSYSMPANARTLTIDFNSGTSKNISENVGSQHYNVNLDYNFAGVIEIAQNTSNNSFILVNDVKDQKDYIVYDVERRTATVYDYNGVAKRTDSPDNILIGFDKVSTAVYSVINVYSTAISIGSASFYENTSDRPQPTMNITALSVDPGEIDYIDITKGYSIKPDNVSDVIWNNGYENGNIQLLFRSLDTSETYHNTLSISGNTIDVDYIASKFYVSLNGDDAVNIGTWRNIILDIDLENGTLNAIPVRTFNSFTNVQMDNAVIPIGELVSAAPTNTITWDDTPNSLLFNVYLTSVFMDTYGVVMADPALNITDYFTNLDNFYRLKLSKFSVIGDSITINGQTYPVSDNTVTIDNKTLQIKDVYITYADGHAYIEDSNTVIDLGEITSNIVSMTGAWYFETYLEKGYTQLKQIYTWDWSSFILDNTQFCIFYIGLAVAGLIVARRFCSMSIIDYAVFIVSIVIALGVQVIA